MLNKIIKFKSLIILLVYFIVFNLYSQQYTVLDAGTKVKTVNKISKMLKERYVFPETAVKMGDFIKSQLKNNSYDSINDPLKFADKLTSDLQSISNDKHIRVRFNPEDAKRLLDQEKKGPDPEQEKLMIEMLKKENYGFKKVERLSGNIGYVDFRIFADAELAKETIVSVMAFLANTDAIIFDLRLNGGGFPEGIRLISSYLFGDKPVHLNDIYLRPDDKTVEFWTFKKVDGKKMPDVPVYVLTSSFTFSGAEEFTYNLKNLKRATIVGETTGGGAHPGGLVPLNKMFVIFIPIGRAINPITKINWEGTGVSPDVPVPSEKALETAQVLALKKLAENTKDPQNKILYEWIAESITMAMNATVIDDKILQAYSGTYGDRKIFYEGGKLYYQRRGRQKFLMTPVSEDTFMFRDIENFRLRFEKDTNGKVTGVTGLYDNGNTDTSPKTD